MSASAWSEMMSWKKKNLLAVQSFQEKIAHGEPNDWRCRAVSRFLYICENGLAHYCSQQRGYPGVPLAEYTKAGSEVGTLTEKGCAPNCTVSCVHQISFIDYWRAPRGQRRLRRRTLRSW